MKKYLAMILSACLLVTSVSAPAYAEPTKQTVKKKKTRKKLSKKQIEACVDKWVNAYRAEVGQESIVRMDMLGEWESWCKKGKQPK